MTENEAIKTDEELGCEIACEVIAKANEKSIEFETKIMDVTLGRWGYCKNDIEKALTELQEYRKLGTVEECREAIDKTNGMKVTDIHVDEYYCPNCGSENLCDQGVIGDKYCPNCGQRLESEE